MKLCFQDEAKKKQRQTQRDNSTPKYKNHSVFQRVENDDVKTIILGNKPLGDVTRGRCASPTAVDWTVDGRVLLQWRPGLDGVSTVFGSIEVKPKCVFV